MSTRLSASAEKFVIHPVNTEHVENVYQELAQHRFDATSTRTKSIVSLNWMPEVCKFAIQQIVRNKQIHMMVDIFGREFGI